MKQFRIIIFGLLFLLFGATMFWACSSEEETMIDTKANFRTFSSGELVNLGHILNEFYDREVTFTTGRTETVRQEVTHYDYTEIIIDSDTRARGYLVSNHTTGEFLYFADVDRTNYVFKTKNLITNERETVIDIDQHPDYGHSDGFDFIRIIDDIDNNGYVTFGGRFWGWSCGPSFYLPGSGCVRNCNYYVLGQQMTQTTQHPVNDLPGSNPKVDDLGDGC